MAPAPAKLRWDLPNPGFGIGLRPVHYPYILSKWPKVDWFEIISENFMDTGGRPMKVLDQVLERYPIGLHGVSLSIGSVDPINRDYLNKLKALAARCKAIWISDHFCWTGVRGRNTHELIPLPYTEETLRHVVKRVRIVQDILERPIALENPSSYLEFTFATMPEHEFIARVAEEADCGIHLDINNVYVACYNHGWDAYEYLDGLPHDRVVYYHLAGHTNCGTHIIDTHSDHIIDPVFDLLRHAWKLSGGRAALLEWDQNIPAFPVVLAETRKARRAVARLDRLKPHKRPPARSRPGKRKRAVGGAR